jgi:hypothetical protein
MHMNTSGRISGALYLVVQSNLTPDGANVLGLGYLLGSLHEDLAAAAAIAM